MARPVVLGNGRLTVGLDERGLVHDFYYPYVGLDNLTTSRSLHHKIGVWVDGRFSWTDDGSWECKVDFSTNELVSDIELRNNELDLSLKLNDFVDFDMDVFCRTVTIFNNSDTKREVRLFMHQVFQISRSGRADTGLYVPEEHYILDYKGRVNLLIGGMTHGGKKFDQYAVGSYGIEGKQGTFMDAEDGELSNHPVEHGGVDSVIRYKLDIDANSSQGVDYWIVAAESKHSGEIIHDQLKNTGLKSRLEENKHYWHRWLSTGAQRLNNVSDDYVGMIRKSLMLIKAHTDDRGGVIASCDSSIYNYGRDYYSYVWPRDGAYVMWPLIRLGYTEEPKAFFRFCRDVLTSEGYLMHKYQPDRSVGSSWHSLLQDGKKELAIQEDETAGVLIMLGEFDQVSNDDEFSREMFGDFVMPAANFLAKFIDMSTGLPHPSYDLWEEKFITSTYTTSMVYRALLVAADFAEKFGTDDQAAQWRATANSILEKRKTFINPDRPGYRKGLLLKDDASLNFDNTLDVSSLYGVITFGFYKEEDALDIKNSFEELEKSLLNHSPSGGSPRYENDYYFRTSNEHHGNPWIITTLWMAQFYIRYRRFEEVKTILEWVHDRALHSGVLPEQVNSTSGDPISVTPLVWSHAEYVNTVLDLSHVYSE